jgi:prepilin-type N-terminal cleavage/methylation domain-containing protein
MPRPDETTRASDATRGFTLLEIVIVLVIVAMTSAIVFPRLVTMAASYEFATQRDTLEQALNGLSYAAVRENADMILFGTYTDAGRDEQKQRGRDFGDTLKPGMQTRSLLTNAREHLPPVNPEAVKVPLPAGWSLVVDEPIYFKGSGFCSGGTVNVLIGRLQYAYEMKPPLCRAVLVE